MSDSQIEEIKNKINIVDIIGEHVTLTKSGTNFKGLCPFHQEKTPSFMVSEELQIYKCFGCGEGGDVFNFLQKYENMDFSEALRFLAQKSGVVLKQSNGFEISDKDILYEINALSAKFYNYLLTNHPVGKIALNYLQEERKINLDSITTFNLGFAPASKNSLSDFLLKKKKYKVKDLEKAGVIFISKNGHIYDRFQGRIIFPILDHRGNVIALAGRQLPPGNPKTGKYINSPQTPIYDKSSSLYGLNTTKDFIKKETFAVVVEGELDLISSFQIGMKNIVAIKGSAFTLDQAKLLARYTKQVILALDSDFAGIKASIRGIKILEDEGFEVRIAELGIYKDPDDAAKKNPGFLKEKISKSVAFWDYIIDQTIGQYDPETATGKAKISAELTPVLANITNKIVQEHYIHKLGQLLEVSDESVAEEVDKKTVFQPQQNQSDNVTVPIPLGELREESLISLILKTNKTLLKNKEIKNLIKTPILKRLIEELEDNPKNLPKELFDKFAQLSLAKDIINPKSEINNIYRLLKIKDLKEQLQKAKISSEYNKLQKQLKDFESGNFGRIIA